MTLVVTDLDGTLWGRDTVASPAIRAAVAELLADGHAVLAATARRPRAARALLDASDLALPVVGQNGAMGVWLTRLSDDHGVTRLALDAKSPDALLDELYLQVLTRLWCVFAVGILLKQRLQIALAGCLPLQSVVRGHQGFGLGK